MKSEMAEVGNMDKIRDILFGNQAKDYEKRFARMETRLTQEAGELKNELLKRIDALEVYIKQETKDINKRIKNESRDRNEAQTSRDPFLSGRMKPIAMKDLAQTIKRPLEKEPGKL